MVRLRWEVDFKDSEIGMLKTDGSAHYIFAHGVCGRIPKDWKIKRIDDEYKVNTGERVSPDSEGLFPVYGANGFSGYSKNFLIEKEAIITGRVGTIGQVFRVKGKVNISDNALYITKRNEESVIDFLYYAFKLIFSNIEEVLNVGTTQPLIKQSEVQKFSIHFPEREEQERIASVLSWFDDLIENKKKQNEILEKMAMAIFKSWFIDFEPYQQDNLKETPLRWKIGKITDIVKDIISGTGRYAIESSSGNYSLWGANGIIGYVDEYDLDNYIILTGRVGTLGQVFFTKEKIAISDNVLALVPKEDYYTFFLYLWLKTQVNFESLNVGSSQPLITKTALGNETVLVPSQAVLQEFHKLVEPLFQKIILNQKQIIVLEKIRDVLLPLLVFGRLKVEEI